jgi:methylmalonyl-CoA/ethylmalonyl-CoA epimerase
MSSKYIDAHNAFRLDYFCKNYFMKKIEHVGIAVKKLSVSIPLFEKILNTPCYKTEVLPDELVNTAFFETGKNKIELLEGYSPDSVISKFIEKRGEGLHHIAFEVDNIEAEMKRLTDEGFTLLNAKPKEGADNKLICFLHPKDTNGVLIELVTSK